MSKTKGFIKIFRDIKDWEWFENPDTLCVFIHLLISANYEDKKWQGRTIKRGSLIIGVRKFAEECGLSYQRTRNALKRLERTQCITQSATRKFTEISIINYNKYQSSTQPSTNKQRTNNAQINEQTTTTKEYNTTYYKEEKKKRNSAATSAASEGGESQPLTTWDMQKELGVDA